MLVFEPVGFDLEPRQLFGRVRWPDSDAEEVGNDAAEAPFSGSEAESAVTRAQLVTRPRK